MFQKSSSCPRLYAAIFEKNVRLLSSLQIRKFYSSQIGQDFIDSYFVFNMAGNVPQIWLAAAHLPEGFY